ncbi:hypothetical protein [Xanthomonas theicola]|uniref:hypothetical protein n=1 Tax=Xanthomonas theicola TaxID=56464 RepID=UPI000FF87E85|nr:hypothetical protein [Xanthomonas theicola]QNH26150.1 hypothetical protein G4Q83_17330 [Xanthomonas theicola]
MSARDLVNLAGADLVAEPVAHFVKDGFLEPPRFAALRDSFPGRDAFAAPEVARLAGGRSDLEPGMEGYRRFLAATPVWRDGMAPVAFARLRRVPARCVRAVPARAVEMAPGVARAPSGQRLSASAAATGCGVGARRAPSRGRAWTGSHIAASPPARALLP